MPELTKQILLKMMPELEETIENAFSEYLKLTGDPITKAEYIRRILDRKCSLELKEADFRAKQKEHMIIKYPKLFASRLGKELFFQFMKGFSACNKFQASMDLYVMNNAYNVDPIASKRNNVHLFFRIISDIYEFEDTLNNILGKIYQDQKRFTKTLSSQYYINLSSFRKQINKNPHYSKIRNQIGSHDGNKHYFSIGLDKVDNDGYFVFGECLSDPKTNVALSNSIIYNSTDLILRALDISDVEWANLMSQSLKITGKCVDDFQYLFNLVYTETLADAQIYRENVRD